MHITNYWTSDYEFHPIQFDELKFSNAYEKCENEFWNVFAMAKLYTMHGKLNFRKMCLKIRVSVSVVVWKTKNSIVNTHWTTDGNGDVCIG